MDQELVSIMQQLADLTAKVQLIIEKPKTKATKKTAKKEVEKRSPKKKASRSGKKPHPSHIDDFVMNKNKSDTSIKKGVPVKGKGINLYEDDGVTAKDVETPIIPLTERRRPKASNKKIKCEKCGDKFKPVIDGNFNSKKLCNKCLVKGVRDDED
jgi:hypothetical protein